MNKILWRERVGIEPYYRAYKLLIYKYKCVQQKAPVHGLFTVFRKSTSQLDGFSNVFAARFFIELAKKGCVQKDQESISCSLTIYLTHMQDFFAVH